MNFDKLKKKYKWKEIHGCPGRYILKEKYLSLADLVDPDDKILEFESKKAKDRVFVIRFDDGGLISYKKDDGFIHTLNDISGFERKLKMLEIIF